MKDGINKFHNDAFSKAEDFKSDVDSAFEKAPYIRGLRSQGMPIQKYTSGDTLYQPEKPFVDSDLTLLPSAISKRYSPQNDEQNAGQPIPPDPFFIKDDFTSERITSIKNLFSQKNTNSIDKNNPIPGKDFAKTHPGAALLLKKLGKNVTYEAHHSALKKEQSIDFDTNDLDQQSVISTSRIVVSQSDNNTQDFKSKIISNTPEKNININLKPIGHELLSDSKNVNTNDDNASFHSKTSKIMFNNIAATTHDVPKTTNREENLIHLIERKIHSNNTSETPTQSTAPLIIRSVIEDYSKMKDAQTKERQMQMRMIENRIKKIIHLDLPEEIETNNDVVVEIKEIIREVVENHPNLIRKTDNESEMIFNTKDAFLRVQIEQELREKFESKIIENNKLMEKNTRLLFDEMIHNFLNS
jgi:hypothetical protein